MSIICGTDLSAGSGGALEVACALAIQRGDREVVLVHVVDGEDRDDRDQRLELARVALDAQAAKVENIAVRAELVVGTPEVTLITFAETEGADLIVISASSERGSLLRLGSTAERVIMSTRVPVLVVRDPAPWLAFARGDRPLRLLLGIDDSVACDLGIQWTHALRARGQVDVVLGAIYYPDDAAAHYGLHAGTLVDRDPEIERLMVRDLLRRYGATDRVVARAQRGLGRIGDHLAELARDEAVDVIVVGTGQKTGLDRLGSVSSVVVHSAAQSVVCVPPNAAVPTLVTPTLATALIATDLSPLGNRAVAYAYAAVAGEIHVVHVLPPDAEADEAELERALLGLASAAAARAIVPHVVHGEDAATAIAQTAARIGVDLIVIASRGRAGLTRALVGSVADRLLRATRKPVLVLRPG